ncbi:MAG: putative dehydrogenase [Thermoleophilia bacterium]|nr:putative dehydrogenase [Thermoleophilia bacterium]MCZ4496351.1 putative dehydrogenase [Thermoleophilia bacterium]
MVASSTAQRTALVTGSARRVGRLIAQALVADGWRVLIHATLEQAARDAADAMGAAGSVGADLRDPEAADVIAAAVRTQLGGRLDLLVNSASSFERVEQWEAAGLDGWARAMDVNARAPYLLMGALLPELTAAEGLIVNISDRAAHEHWPTFPIHSASKAALDSLTLSGATALAPVGVRVNAIAPGTILPPDSWDAARIKLEEAAGRIGSTDELASLVIALANDPARTGEIIVL